MYISSFLGDIVTLVWGAKDHLQAGLSLPFDVARANYAMAVKVGLIERSMRASAKFGRNLTY